MRFNVWGLDAYGGVGYKEFLCYGGCHRVSCCSQLALLMLMCKTMVIDMNYFGCDGLLFLVDALSDMMHVHYSGT